MSANARVVIFLFMADSVLVRSRAGAHAQEKDAVLLRGILCGRARCSVKLLSLRAKARAVDDAYEDAVERNLDRAHSIGDYRFPTVDIRKTAGAAGYEPTLRGCSDPATGSLAGHHQSSRCTNSRSVPAHGLSLDGASRLVNWREAGASFHMPVHSIEAADCPAGEQHLLIIGRAGVLSNRAIGAEELDTLLRLLGPPSERQRTDVKRATDIVLVEDGAMIYWPRTGEQFTDAAYAMGRVQATLAA